MPSLWYIKVGFLIDLNNRASYFGHHQPLPIRSNGSWIWVSRNWLKLVAHLIHMLDWISMSIKNTARQSKIWQCINYLTPQLEWGYQDIHQHKQFNRQTNEYILWYSNTGKSIMFTHFGHFRLAHTQIELRLEWEWDQYTNTIDKRNIARRSKSKVYSLLRRF